MGSFGDQAIGATCGSEWCFGFCFGRGHSAFRDRPVTDRPPTAEAGFRLPAILEPPESRTLRVIFPVFFAVGEWLSLVEHLVRDQGVGGSNPLSPTKLL